MTNAEATRMFSKVERPGVQPLPANKSCWRYTGRWLPVLSRDDLRRHARVVAIAFHQARGTLHRRHAA